jgi:hypothetical protein
MNKLAYVIIAVVVGVSLFVAIIYIDGVKTATKIQDMKDCKVWVTSLNKCASEELTQWYLNHQGVKAQ